MATKDIMRLKDICQAGQRRTMTWKSRVYLRFDIMILIITVDSETIFLMVIFMIKGALNGRSRFIVFRTDTLLVDDTNTTAGGRRGQDFIHGRV